MTDGGALGGGSTPAGDHDGHAANRLSTFYDH